MEYYPFNIRFYELKLNILRQPSLSVLPSHRPQVVDRVGFAVTTQSFTNVYTSAAP